MHLSEAKSKTQMAARVTMRSWINPSTKVSKVTIVAAKVTIDKLILVHSLTSI